MDSKTIQHIARLARIRLTEREEDKFKEELSSVLDYIDQLNKVDTENVEPLYQTTGLINSVRKDEYRKDFEMDENINQRLIGQAPQRESRFIKVKSVLQK